ncbi:MAG: hypothetical protein MUC56_00110 [Thermoanaerobaculales bacterium]|nr:hypothetical protein [Thermoanaerobaculales bacterium]
MAHRSHSHFPHPRHRRSASRDGWLAQLEITRMSGRAVRVGLWVGGGVL